MKTVLIDARNFDQVASQVIAQVKAAPFTGLDCETEDDGRHDGLNSYCGYDPVTRKKPKTKPLVFDFRRTNMCGYSLYPEGADESYYLNLHHADVENRVPWEQAKVLLDALPEQSYFVAHNAPFELTAFRACHGYILERVICSMQMCVSAYGPDEYDREVFRQTNLGAIRNLLPGLILHTRGYQGGRNMKPELAEIYYKIVAKEADAAHSYNGWVDTISYGYGLKDAVKTWFGVDMTTFEQVLRGKAHMGQLTGEETAAYGADDAYWAIRLFRRMLEYMAANCPDTIPTFFSQENPMAEVYSDIWINGMKVNGPPIEGRRAEERHNMAVELRKMKDVVRGLLPFPAERNEVLAEHDEWYAKNWKTYRTRIEQWAKMPDSDDDYTQCQQIRGAVSNAWATERGQRESAGLNLTHYMPMRVMLYDLAQERPIVIEGKTQSDGEARGRLRTRIEKKNDQRGLGIIDGLNAMAGIEQRMKLYLTPYIQLKDPETDRLYPAVNSMLATRRMGARYPNPMQLAKRGESTYVRGFFEPDYEDHLIVSLDWSGIELVEIGEFSNDPEFFKAFGQIPHGDLHAGAAADILAVEVPDLDEETFKALKFISEQDAKYLHPRLTTNLKGEVLPYNKIYSYWRTEIGKGANFNYWYSGFLGTVGERMGWSTETTGEATERYRQRFSVAEKWRVDQIDLLKRQGFLLLPDGHRRVRYEATEEWARLFRQKFDLQVETDGLEGYYLLVNQIIRSIQTRANNQGINSLIQGTCSTLAKRSILRIRAKMKELGWTDREARFMLPIHDELLFSVHRDYIVPFIEMAKAVMLDHPDIFKIMKPDSSPAVGWTFQPFDLKKAPFGQVELYEAPAIPNVVPLERVGKRLNDDEVRSVVDYLSFQRKLAA